MAVFHTPLCSCRLLGFLGVCNIYNRIQNFFQTVCRNFCSGNKHKIHRQQHRCHHHLHQIGNARHDFLYVHIACLRLQSAKPKNPDDCAVYQNHHYRGHQKHHAKRTDGGFFIILIGLIKFFDFIIMAHKGFYHANPCKTFPHYCIYLIELFLH